jgi:hypothetical protein
LLDLGFLYGFCFRLIVQDIVQTLAHVMLHKCPFASASRYRPNPGVGYAVIVRLAAA